MQVIIVYSIYYAVNTYYTACRGVYTGGSAGCSFYPTVHSGYMGRENVYAIFKFFKFYGT